MLGITVCHASWQASEAVGAMGQLQPQHKGGTITVNVPESWGQGRGSLQARRSLAPSAAQLGRRRCSPA